jgi:formylglycine-generating enzyme required for sulfatase activity
MPVRGDRWDEQTEEFERPVPPLERFAGDDRDMWRVGPRLLIDATPVTRAAYSRFVFATGHPAPPTGPRLDDEAPVVNVSIEDARAYARWARKRLPLLREWDYALGRIGLVAARGGDVWEWTASRHRAGHVVRGGRHRDRPDEPGRFQNQSWEDRPCADVGFRCVVDG